MFLTGRDKIPANAPLLMKKLLERDVQLPKLVDLPARFSVAFPLRVEHRAVNADEREFDSTIQPNNSTWRIFYDRSLVLLRQFCQYNCTKITGKR